MRKTQRRPVLGSAFKQDQTNDEERLTNYVYELRYYRPRGFSKLAHEGDTIIAGLQIDADGAAENACALMQEIDDMLTEWARRVTRNDFICFGPFEDSGSVGFYIDVESAKESADAIVGDTGELPRGFSGLALQISDHGNVTGLAYSRGRCTREIFAVV